MKPYSKSQSLGKQETKQPEKDHHYTSKEFRQMYLKNFRKKNKYKNKRKFYNGRTYDSILEANFAEELDWRIKEGEIKEVLPQFKIELRGLQGKRVTNYFIDFKVINWDDSITYFEVKGYATALWQLKWAMTLQQIAIDEPYSDLIIIK